MIYYDVIVELMNIHEIICKISNQAISGTSHDNLVRFSAISSFHQCLLQFYKIKKDMPFNSHAGADPGFLEGGFKSTKGGSFPTFHLIFHKFSHENERICLQRGFKRPPRTPSKSATAMVAILVM